MNNPIIIAIDAMGGDNSPDKVIEGISLHSKKSENVKYEIFGNKNQIIPLINKYKISSSRYNLVHTDKLIEGKDSALSGAKRGKTTSLWLAIESLKKNNLQNWLLYTKHDFLKQLSDNSLKKDCFLNYLKQDYLFLIQFSKAWSLAVLKSDNLDEMKISASTVNDLINFEMQLHIDLCDEYGISKTDLENTDEQNENIAYTRYVLELGYSGDFLDLLSSLAPCVLGYGEIGLNLKDFKPDNVMYQKWIETYASNEYQDVCKNVSQLIDNSFLIRLGNNYKNTYKWVQANKIFNKATLLEVDFWNMALK